MPRSPEEKRRLAIKYGRRARLLQASHSGKTLEVEVKRLVAELKRSSLPPARIKALVDNLSAFTDERRRNHAIWALVDALESLPETPRK